MTSAPWREREDFRYEITSLSIAEGVTDICHQAFYQTFDLTEVVIPTSVTEIGGTAFANSGVTRAEIRGATGIQSYAFNSCSELKTLVLSKEIPWIGQNAFDSNCTSLTDIYFTGTEGEWDIFLQVNARQGKGNDALRNATNVVCNWVIEPEEQLPENACGKNLTWEYANGVLTISGSGDMFDYTLDNPAPWAIHRADIEMIELGDALTSIGNFAFAHCIKIIGCLSRSVTRIGDFAFWGCTDLPGIAFSEDSCITEIGQYAFWECTNIYTMHLNGALEKIRTGAFQKCTALKTISLPKGLQIIEDYAFSNCDALIEATYDGTEDMWNQVNVGSHNEKLLNVLAYERRFDVEISDGTLVQEWNRAVYTFKVTIDNNSTRNTLTNVLCGVNPGTGAVLEHEKNVQKLTSLAPGEKAVFEWTIRIDRNTYPDGGTHEIHITACADETEFVSLKDSVALDAINGQDNRLDFKKDVWKFVNWKDKPVCDITEEHKAHFLQGLSPTDVALVEEWSAGVPGHCYGMSATVILEKMNVVDMSRFTGVSTLREAKKGNHDTHSILCYYQNTQLLSGARADRQNYMELDTDDQLLMLAKKVNKIKTGETPVLFAFGSDKGSHAVVAYALESGSFRSSETGIVYNNRVLLYDSNAWDPLNGVHLDKDNCFLFNDDTEAHPWAWEIPAYVDDYKFYSGNPDAYLCRCTNDLNIIDVNKYTASAYNYNAELRIQRAERIILENIESGQQWTIDGTDGYVQGDSDLLIYCDSGISEDSVPQYLNVVLPDENARYRISPVVGGNIGLDVSVLFDDRYVSVVSGEACSITLNSTGTVEMDGNIGEFEVIIADDNIPENAFNTFSVVGDREGKIALEICNDELKISGNNLRGVAVEASEDKISDSITITDFVDIVTIGRKNEKLEITSVVKKDIAISQKYVALQPGETVQLVAKAQPDELTELIQWSVENVDESVASVDEQGLVTVNNVGTAYVIASVTEGETTLTNRCRIDVVDTEVDDPKEPGEEVAPMIKIDGIQLNTTKLAAELYSTNYAEFDLLLELPQNYSGSSVGSKTPEKNSVAIEDIWFADSAAREAFDLIPLDDRRIAVVPTEYALKNPGALAKSYSSTVKAKVGEKEHTTEEMLTLTVKKTLPKLKGTISEFNSFYPGQAQKISITGATVTKISLNPGKPQPDWLDLQGETLVLNEKASVKNSGKVYLLVETKEWTVPAEVELPVKNTCKAVTVAFKVTGNTDSSNASQQAVITPSFKNYSGSFTLAQSEIGQFVFTQNGSTILASCKAGTVPGSHTVKLELNLADGKTVENTVKISVKQTVIKLKLSASKLTLNKLYGDKGSVTVTSATKGYTLGTPIRELMDKTGRNSAAGKLDLGYENGRLTVAVNDSTEYGATYKILVKAGENQPAQTLTVTIPDRSKSAVTATLKAKGILDVIRDGSSITLTPTYKNLGDLAEKEETLVFFKAAGKEQVDVSELFAYSKNADGSFKVTKAEGAELDHSAKYTAKLVTRIKGVPVAESKAVSLSVKMGKAQLTVTTGDTTLFVRDKHDRVTFRITSADAALNDIALVTIKDAKFADKLEVIDYGNGEYALGFKDGMVHGDLIGKKITVNLNVFLEGNLTAKANATVKLKLQMLE